MENLFLELIFILILILLNGFLSLSELAIISARRTRLQQISERGDTRAGVALELAQMPGRFLSTVQIGITLVGVLAGALGGATLAHEIARWLEPVPFLAPYSNAIGVGLVVLGITYFTIVLGELVPKQIALSNAEGIASAVAPAMRWFAKVFSPLVSLFSLSSGFVLRMLGIKLSQEQVVTEDEIKLLIGQGAQAGIFEPFEEELVQQIFRLADRTAASLITPRTEIEMLDLEDPAQVIRQKIAAAGFSNYPVVRGNLDDLLGYVRSSDCLTLCLENKPLNLESILKPPLVVPESMPVFRLLEQMKVKRTKIAFVLDEYGGTSGLITLKDILEAIVGELPEAHEVDGEIVEREDGSWLVDGMLDIDELRDHFDLPELYMEKENYYNTVGGFVMTYLERVPVPGDHFHWGGLRIEVVDMDGKRVDKVLIARQAIEP